MSQQCLLTANMAILTRKFRPEQDSKLFDPESGNCSIEYYNACKDPYRVSANKFPVPRPWISEKFSEASQAIHEQLDDSIRKILSDHKTRRSLSASTTLRRGILQKMQSRRYGLELAVSTLHRGKKLLRRSTKSLSLRQQLPRSRCEWRYATKI